MADLNKVIEDSFIQFSGAVLQSRALVDVRDCIKPSARQIFYCLYTDKFISSKPFQKTLKAIGSAFRIYIHGDSSAEGVIMRAGQPFAMRYPLIEVEGSYGTLLSASSWAAPRYTAARLSKLANYLFADLDKETIEEWRDNYDNTEKYPAVLPSKGFYNLVNGTFGLGVGASSSIPQYNLKELNNALITLIKNPNCTFDEIYCEPDFATGAILINASQVKESHKKGNGYACKLRSVVEWDSKNRCFIVTEIPYMTYTETICKELEEIINSENNFGIERFNDLTGKTPLIKIYLSKNANPDKVLKRLYKETSLESYYGINFTMLDNGRFPRVFTWKEMLQAHIDHERIVYRRGFEFDLKKIEKRLHIIEGLLICCANIEEVVRLIKSSTSTAAAMKNLCETYKLDESQAKAVLDMKLSRLAHLEVQKLETEKISLESEKEKIEKILSSQEALDGELIRGWEETSRLFGDDRRTKILDLANSDADEPIEVKRISISFTSEGGTYAHEVSSLYSQKRNGVGTKFKLSKGEYIVNNLIGDTTDTLLLFSDKGNFYHYKISDLNLGEKQYIADLGNEKIINATILSSNNAAEHIIFITKKGIIKKSKLSDYNLSRRGGAQAIKLDEGDKIRSVLFTNLEKVGILTIKGNFVIIETKDINAIGRITRGIQAIKLNDGDYVQAANIITDSTKEIITITEDGVCKRTKLSEFKVTGRNTKGSKIQKADNLQDFIAMSNSNDLIVTSSMSQIRLKYTDIPLLGRGAQGVKTIKLGENSKVVKIERV